MPRGRRAWAARPGWRGRAGGARVGARGPPGSCAGGGELPAPRGLRPGVRAAGRLWPAVSPGARQPLCYRTAQPQHCEAPAPCLRTVHEGRVGGVPSLRLLLVVFLPLLPCGGPCCRQGSAPRSRIRRVAHVIMSLPVEESVADFALESEPRGFEIPAAQLPAGPPGHACRWLPLRHLLLTGTRHSGDAGSGHGKGGAWDI